MQAIGSEGGTRLNRLQAGSYIGHQVVYNFQSEIRLLLHGYGQEPIDEFGGLFARQLPRLGNDLVECHGHAGSVHRTGLDSTLAFARVTLGVGGERTEVLGPAGG